MFKCDAGSVLPDAGDDSVLPEVTSLTGLIRLKAGCNVAAPLAASCDVRSLSPGAGCESLAAEDSSCNERTLPISAGFDVRSRDTDCVVDWPPPMLGIDSPPPSVVREAGSLPLAAGCAVSTPRGPLGDRNSSAPENNCDLGCVLSSTGVVGRLLFA